MLVSWKPCVSLVIFTFGALLRSGAPFEGNLACRVGCREQIQFYQLYCRGSPSLSCPSVLLLISSYFCLLPTEIWFKATEVLLLGLLPCSEWQLFAAGTGAPSLSAPNCLPAASFRPSAGSAQAAASPPEQKHARYFRRGRLESVFLWRPRLCCVGRASTWLSWVFCWSWSCFAASEAASFLACSHCARSEVKWLFVTSRRLDWAWIWATWKETGRFKYLLNRRRTAVRR